MFFRNSRLYISSKRQEKYFFLKKIKKYKFKNNTLYLI